jgi:hypothetical protein
VAQVEGLAARQPVLMEYEDMLWSDPTTGESLDRLVDGVPTLRVLAIITFRPEFAPAVGRPSACDLAQSQSAATPATRRDDYAGDWRRGVAKGNCRPIINRTDGCRYSLKSWTGAVF